VFKLDTMCLNHNLKIKICLEFSLTM